MYNYRGTDLSLGYDDLHQIIEWALKERNQMINIGMFPDHFCNFTSNRSFEKELEEAADRYGYEYLPYECLNDFMNGEEIAFDNEDQVFNIIDNWTESFYGSVLPYRDLVETHCEYPYKDYHNWTHNYDEVFGSDLIYFDPQINKDDYENIKEVNKNDPDFNFCCLVCINGRMAIHLSYEPHEGSIFYSKLFWRDNGQVLTEEEREKYEV